MKAKLPRPLRYPDRTCWYVRENGNYCGCYAERRSYTDGHPYCPRHYALLSRAARGEYDRSILPPVARDRDGNFVRYPAGSTVEETEEIRQSGWKPTSQVRGAKPSREERQSAEARAASVELATERLNDAPQTAKTARKAAPTPRKRVKRRAAQLKQYEHGLTP